MILTLLRAKITAFVLFLCLVGNSQQPVLVVKSFEYIWQKDFVAMSASAPPRVIILLDDSAKLLIKNIFVKAIQDRWSVVMPDVSLAVRPLPILANTPKFNTRIKDKEPGMWYLFLQVYDKGNTTNFFNEADTFATTLELRCKLVSGTKDSVIIERDLTVNIYKESAAPDQVQLTRLPSYPAAFVKGFDSIATWLFQPETAGQKSLRLRPACVFQETGTKESLPIQLSFMNDNESIHHLSAPVFSFRTAGPGYERTDAKRNIGGNTAGGALTLFTGIKTNKSRTFEYQADYPFEEKDSIYHCLIAYAEKETAEQERVHDNDNGTRSTSVKGTNYRLLMRYTDTASLDMITLGTDTLATFNIRYANEDVAHTGYNRLWDGSDSATITALPPGWNNKKEETNVEISGKAGGNSFTMKTSKETRVKEFYIDGVFVAVIHGKDKPAKGFALPSISSRQLKLFTILSSLPYAYFNVLH